VSDIEIDGVLRDAWKEPMHGTFIIRGNIHGDRKRRFPDGFPIHTSLVKSEIEPDIFRTNNSVYRVESWGPEKNFDSFPEATSYRLKNARFEHPAGTICYPATGYDYGLCRDDEAATGIPHRSVTLDPAGGNPFFTCPIVDLEPLS
jgi:hypothetical protein